MSLLNRMFGIRVDDERITKYKRVAAYLGRKPHVWARETLDNEADRIIHERKQARSSRKREKNGDKP